MHVGKSLLAGGSEKLAGPKLWSFPVPILYQRHLGFATHPMLDAGPISNPDEGEPVLGSPFQLRRGFNLTAYAKPPRRIKGLRGVSGWGVGGAAGCCRRQEGVAGDMMERVGCSGLGGLGAREPACREPREPESRMLSLHHWQALAMEGIVIRFLIADRRPIDVNSIKKTPSTDLQEG